MIFHYWKMCGGWGVLPLPFSILMFPYKLSIGDVKKIVIFRKLYQSHEGGVGERDIYF